MDSVSLRSTQQGKCQARTIYEFTHETRSALDQPSKENVKDVQAANAQTHRTQSALDQPSKQIVKDVRSTNSQTHEAW